MKYCDMHCDALTQEGVLQIQGDFLRKNGCLLQCFAVFLHGEKATFTQAQAQIDRFEALCRANGYRRVRKSGEVREGEVNALLTVENGAVIGNDLRDLDALYQRGVRMMTLIWNERNGLGFPNGRGAVEGVAVRARERERGLTAFGVEAVERMNELGVIVDVSHGSDKLLSDVAAISKKPFVASHSNAQSAYDCSRNLTDEQIRIIADCGGVVGLNFCPYFLAEQNTAEVQREAMLRHIRAILNAGGEEVLALGSDFDGIPPNAYLPNAGELFKLFEEVEGAFGARILEKFTCKNFLRVFREVCG